VIGQHVAADDAAVVGRGGEIRIGGDGLGRHVERDGDGGAGGGSEEHTSELQSRGDVVCRRLLVKTADGLRVVGEGAVAGERHRGAHGAGEPAAIVFPYTTLFRSVIGQHVAADDAAVVGRGGEIRIGGDGLGRHVERDGDGGAGG